MAYVATAQLCLCSTETAIDNISSGSGTDLVTPELEDGQCHSLVEGTLQEWLVRGKEEGRAGIPGAQFSICSVEGLKWLHGEVSLEFN